MKIATFGHDGEISYGVVVGEGIIDVGKVLGDRYPTLRHILDAGAMEEVAKVAETEGPDYMISDVVLLPVVPNPDKILCVGLNYQTHRAETGRGDDTAHPTIFTRFSNTQVGHNQPMLAPAESIAFDYEGEIALIIGKTGRRIKPEDALSHVAGYACYNDGSIRDFQRHTSQFTPGKNFYATGGFGPWMVTSDEIPDPTTLVLTTRLNGEEVQHAPATDLIFGFETIIEYCSIFTELVPGDVIVTGTPGGVGAARTPPLWMKDGDTVEVEVSGVGILSNPIVAG